MCTSVHTRRDTRDTDTHAHTHEQSHVAQYTLYYPVLCLHVSGPWLVVVEMKHTKRKSFHPKLAIAIHKKEASSPNGNQTQKDEAYTVSEVPFNPMRGACLNVVQYLSLNNTSKDPQKAYS